MSKKFLDGQCAVVTGGTRGIGAAIAERLLLEGASVAICGARQKSVDEAVVRLSQKGQLYAKQTDVSKLNEVRDFAAAVKDRFRTVDILINNAGVGVFKGAADLAPEEWNQMLGINLTGVFYCCHEFLPIMRGAGKGDVINISSLAGKSPFAGGAGYNASKFGLNGFSEAIMLDYRNEGIRVSTIMPGSVETGFGGNSTQVGVNTNSWKVAPQDVADVVVALLAMPRRTTVSEVHIRPSRPPVRK